ncbi:MAG: AraC family transcriptional regulator [Kiritimatiellia bacterium]
MARAKSNLELSLLLAEMAEDIRYRKSLEKENGDKAASPIWLDSVLQYAWKSGSANMSVKEMAQYAGIQEDVFARSFHEATGFNPKHFLMRVKNEKAKEMLQARGLLCKEVAARLGFKSQEHFTRFFCKFNGVSPARWAKVSCRAGNTNAAGKIGMDPGSGCFFAEN